MSVEEGELRSPHGDRDRVTSVLLMQMRPETQVNRTRSRIEETFANDIRQAFPLSVAEARNVAARTMQATLAGETGGEIGHICCANTLRRVGEYWYTIDKELHTGRLQYIFVSPKWRGKGYGKAALAIIHANLEKTGCKRIELTVLATNLAAMRLYQSVGYVVGSHEMACALSPMRPET